MATEGTGYEDPPYWGNDRRQALARPEGSPARALMVGAGLIVTVWAGVNIVGGVATTTRLDTVLLQALLETGAAALAIMVGLLCFVRWRMVGEAAALWAAVAMFVFGTITVALTGLVPLVYEPVLEASAWLRPASRLVAVAFLAAAVVGPAVDGRLRPSRLLLLAAGSTGVAAVTLQLAPGLGQHLAGAADARPGAMVSSYGPLLVMTAWGVLAAAFLFRGAREKRPLLSWLGLLIAGLALAEFTRVVAAENSSLWSVGAHVLRLTALGVGLGGTTLELQRAFSHQSRNLLNTVVSAAATEARMRAGRLEVEERAHEARNALAAIDGASQTLERHRDELDPDTRRSLASALSAEIARLQRLVSPDRVQDKQALFKVAETLAPVVTGARVHGVAVLVDIDDELTAFGRWADTAEVVQNLIENARRYAPGSPVMVRARREGDRVLVRVEDRGPGISPDQKEAIFRRGVRGKQPNGLKGSGLGLFVSGRLMVDQGGDLWLEDRPGGGAAFVVALPAEELPAHEAPADEAPAEEAPAEEAPAEETGSGAVAAGGRPVELGGAALDERDEAVEVADRDRPVADTGNPESGSLG